MARPKRPRNAHSSRSLRFEALEERHLLAIIVVDTTLDVVDAGDGVTSLREAIAASNASQVDDTIHFAPALTAAGPAVIHLTHGELTISDAVTIVGPGAALLTVDASASDPTPDLNNADGSRAFRLNLVSVQRFNLQGIRLTGGDVFSNGGAINGVAHAELRDVTIDHNGGGGMYIQGTVSIYDSELSDNKTQGNGGGLAVQGNLTIVNSLVTRNTAGDLSGGIDQWSGIVLVDNCEISFNSAHNGGGIQTAGRAVEIRNSTISNNRAIGGTFGGGGLFNRTGWGSPESLTIISTTISDNVSESIGGFSQFTEGGGGVLNHAQGIASIVDSVITGNRATGGALAHGGGISTSANSHYVSGTRIEDNETTGRGGGVYISSPFGSASVTDTTISGNKAGSQGGGIRTAGDITLLRSSVLANQTVNVSASGGGVFAQGRVTLTESSVSGNYTLGAQAKGGGIYSPQTASQRMSITRSTISGNYTAGVGATGGGVYSDRGVTALESTISGNFTLGDGADGGGIDAGSEVQLTNTTLVYNSVSGTGAVGGGIMAPSVSVAASIVALNGASGASSNIIGPFSVSANNSLFGDMSGGPMINGPGNLINQDPILGPLVDNGGLTLTHALLPGSPAIDRGSSGVGGFDQRGTPFNRVVDGDGVGGARMDTGAYELQQNPLPGDYNFNHVVDAGDYVLWRKTFGSTSDLRADGNGNGTVDQPDYDFWRSRFGQTLAVGSIEQVAGIGIAGALKLAEPVPHVADAPHPLDSSPPHPGGEVSWLARPELPMAGVVETRVPGDSHAVRSEFKNVPRAARHDGLLTAWLQSCTDVRRNVAATAATSVVNCKDANDGDGLDFAAVDHVFATTHAGSVRRWCL